MAAPATMRYGERAYGYDLPDACAVLAPRIDLTPVPYVVPSPRSPRAALPRVGAHVPL
jgi:hypothetical protein